MSGAKSQVDRLLDATIFVPVGFLLNRGETVEGLATAGRKQLAFSRSLGRAALKGIARQARPDAAQKPATTTKSTKTSKSATAAKTTKTTKSATATKTTKTTVKPTKSATATKKAAPARRSSKAAVDGYADMTAREIIEIVTSASAARAKWIRKTETAGKNRVTVLRALDARG